MVYIPDLTDITETSKLSDPKSTITSILSSYLLVVISFFPLLAASSYANIAALGTDVINYRLKQKDIDGRFTYSKVVTLTFKNKGTLILYPNPAANQINLAITVKRKENLDYRIFDNAGRILIHQTSQVLTGTNNFSVDITKLSAGVYYLKLNSTSLDGLLQFVKR